MKGLNLSLRSIFSTKLIGFISFNGSYEPFSSWAIRWQLLVIVAASVDPGYPVFAQEALQTGVEVKKPASDPTGTTFYVEPGSYGTKRETDPPAYVRNLSKTNITGTEKASWLDVGLDYRVRSEWRNNDIRRPDSHSDDFPFLLRTRAYIGIREIIDPFRMVLEFEDASRVNGNYPLDDKDVNRAELIQGYGELHFKNAFGSDPRGNSRPLVLRAGRMAFEFTDRRLIGLNLWRNTTNNFYGLRASLGQDKNDWQLDLLTLRPIIRLIDKFDVRDQDKLFWAAIGHWRRWSRIVTIEPHYLALRQQPSSANNNAYRLVHSPGLRLYGWVSDSGLNYDLTGNYQFGEDQTLRQKAYAFTAEVGYKMNGHPWKPRVSLFYGYVSGDKDPNDGENNRFERFYGFSRPWSSDDYVIYENIVAPKLKIEIEPIKGVRVDGGYSMYSLASATDRFANLLAGNTMNRDKTGASGKWLGHGLDMRVLFKPAKFIDANVGYTHFTTGEFVRNRQVVANNEFARASNFIYVELSANAFDLFKK